MCQPGLLEAPPGGAEVKPYALVIHTTPGTHDETHHFKFFAEKIIHHTLEEFSTLELILELRKREQSRADEEFRQEVEE